MSSRRRCRERDPDDGEQAAGREGEAGQVEPTVRAVRLLQLPERERDQDEPEGHVQPEDPLPGDALHDRAADERAERDGEAADATPGAERKTAAIRRHGGREDRQRERQHDRAAEPLDRASRDQLVR